MKKIEFVPLLQETRELLTNDEGSVHLRMKPDCLRTKENDPTFPIRPVRIGRRLLWRTADIRRLVGA